MESQSSKTDSRGVREAGQTAPREIDDVDRHILGELAADARLSVRSLAERLHLSRAGAYARLQRLTADGVIEGFSARIDPPKAGLATTAYIALNIEQNTWRTVSAALAQLDYIDTIALLGSEFDVLVQAHAPDNQALRTLVLERIQAIPGVLGTRTWLAFEEISGAGTPWAREQLGLPS
ncbi:AsnC family transcriptional regulator [Rudaeicoccus suwonensis]|uniref:AsnC family transcriptional regulator n=1 Tax=Rudaeicoccus suwonensis TaxID=657409 RepID=A0A561E3D9_9MICO|nr:AsnC family transcriptional regulator [Rudaeicoccus suwonensis]